jgi:hypothetical protein
MKGLWPLLLPVMAGLLAACQGDEMGPLQVYSPVRHADNRAPRAYCIHVGLIIGHYMTAGR